jgi:3-oxoacyl-[acyl-carrier protein] reductase
MRLEGKVAIVTGAGSGFGEGIATLFANEGASVIVADINVDNGKRVASAITAVGGKAAFMRADVSKDADTAAMVAIAVERFGGFDIVVNNAGTTHRNQPMIDVDEETFDRVFAVNVKSIYFAAKHAVPIFRQRGHGAFINIASTAGIRPRPGLCWYSGSKGAAISLTKAMAVELASDKIRVNAINPVMGETALLGDFLGSDTPEKRAKVIATIPLGRLSRPADIANAALYLASDEASMVTGLCMEVDGGRCI